ncbi:hypothetical protein DPMN_039359 [Dreissena polymorpha]|uniref:Uncharacterized protein n=1 Tax=Dreissena polymorpha TaxID=45954 RepID=A0A9D4MH84_DREPO|nr:hypothetical protein DPMN_039359 [Dreissena polymorpha]
MFFLPIQTIFELNCRIHETNVLTKFHADWARNVSYTLFTCFQYIHIENTAPPPHSHVFPPIMTIFELVRDTYKIYAKNVTSRVKMTPRGGHKTHVLTKFHEDWTKHVTSRVFTCFHYIHIEKTAPPLGGHFHDYWAEIVTSRVFTRNAPTPGVHLHVDWASNVTSTVFTSFELSRGINGTNVLTKFHEDQTINVASRVFTRQNVDATGRTKGDYKSSP